MSDIRMIAALATAVALSFSVSYADEADTTESSDPSAVWAAQERLVELYLRNLRAEAKDALLLVEASQEEHFQRNNTYAQDLRDLGFPSNPWVTDAGSYTISISPGADETAYQVVALLNHYGEEAEQCGRFSIDSDGSRHSAPEHDCWIDLPANPVTSEPAALASSWADSSGEN
ncbi:MAG: type IV pilin protein [Woeseiaceae bacterium]|nr:type IV pilin protein [Woeseiaceae bacterium]